MVASDFVSEYSNLSNRDHKDRLWTFHRYHSLRSPESVLPKPKEILAEAEEYSSLRAMIILATFGFLETVERSTSIVDPLPIFGSVSLITKRVTAAFLPYLAEEIEEEEHGVRGIRYDFYHSLTQSISQSIN